MQTDYQKCYNTLNLERGADWDAAKLSYHRLVHEWHPDRHTATPVDSRRAQSYFIELTCSFDAIRKYHRRNKRMPLLRHSDTNESKAHPYRNSDSLLNRAREKEKAKKLAKRNDLKKSAVMVFGAGFVVVVLLFLFSLDKKLALQAGEEAQRALQETTPSPFQRSASEVSRAEAKGAFITHDPSGGALGQNQGQLFAQD